MTDNDATQTRQDDAAKQLRAMLDERGVEWKSIDFDVSKTTLFYAGSEQYIFDDGGGIASPMLAGPLTPAQVIAATLGAADTKPDIADTKSNIADMSANVRMLRRMAGDGSIEWVMEPIKASTLREIADALDASVPFLKLKRHMEVCENHEGPCSECEYIDEYKKDYDSCDFEHDTLYKLGLLEY